MKQPPPEFFTHELVHKYGGNSLFFVRMIDDAFCHCCWLNKEGKPSEVRTLRVDLLTPWSLTKTDDKTGEKTTVLFPIEPKAVAEIKSLRDDLESGKRVIYNNWFIRKS